MGQSELDADTTMKRKREGSESDDGDDETTAHSDFQRRFKDFKRMAFNRGHIRRSFWAAQGRIPSWRAPTLTKGGTGDVGALYTHQSKEIPTGAPEECGLFCPRSFWPQPPKNRRAGEGPALREFPLRCVLDTVKKVEMKLMKQLGPYVHLHYQHDNDALVLIASLLIKWTTKTAINIYNSLER